jgi:hypothetical protein
MYPKLSLSLFFTSNYLFYVFFFPSSMCQIFPILFWGFPFLPSYPKHFINTPSFLSSIPSENDLFCTEENSSQFAAMLAQGSECDGLQPQPGGAQNGPGANPGELFIWHGPGEGGHHSRGQQGWLCGRAQRQAPSLLSAGLWARLGPGNRWWWPRWPRLDATHQQTSTGRARTLPWPISCASTSRPLQLKMIWLWPLVQLWCTHSWLLPPMQEGITGCLRGTGCTHSQGSPVTFIKMRRLRALEGHRKMRSYWISLFFFPPSRGLSKVYIHHLDFKLRPYFVRYVCFKIWPCKFIFFYPMGLQNHFKIVPRGLYMWKLVTKYLTYPSLWIPSPTHHTCLKTRCYGTQELFFPHWAGWEKKIQLYFILIISWSKNNERLKFGF